MYLVTNGRDQKRCLILASLCFVLSLTAGCGRQQSDSNASAIEQTLPFHADSQAFEGDGGTPAVPSDAKVVNATPFHEQSLSVVLPVGTLLTVQLPNSLSANQVQPGDAFSASVASPFTIGGKTLVERGTPVEGRIESVRLDGTTKLAPRGYFRLTLNFLTLGSRKVPIHTLSLYIRASVQPPKNLSPWTISARIQKGRRLTFRLTAPVTLDNPSAVGQFSIGSVPRALRSAE
jgi:hypothetical protein